MHILKNFKTFVLTGALALLVTGCGPTSDEMLADVSKAMTASVVADFKSLKFEEREPYRGLQPTIVFEGKNATLLGMTKPVLWTGVLAPDEVKLSGLAVSKNGRYFEFVYRSPLAVPGHLPFLASPCVDSGCRHFEHTGAVSRQRAMEWFFNSDEFPPERFKELFDEEAPPKRVEA